MSRLTGSTGLVVGVANKRSIAWAIARAAAAEGASLVLTYQNDRLGENVRELAATLPEPPLLLPCDVTDDAQMDALFQAIGEQHGNDHTEPTTLAGGQYPRRARAPPG